MTADIVTFKPKPTVANLSDYRDTPDAEHVEPDQWGRPMLRFIAEYVHAERPWSLDIWAFSMQDAEARAEAIGNVTILGQVYETGKL
jgi:hypothetical protein